MYIMICSEDMLSEKLMKILTVPSNLLSLCFISLRFLTRWRTRLRKRPLQSRRKQGCDSLTIFCFQLDRLDAAIVEEEAEKSANVMKDDEKVDKRKRSSDASPDDDKKDAKRIEVEDISTLNAIELKDALSTRGLLTSGQKAELVERLTELPAAGGEAPIDEDASVAAELPETPIEEKKIGEVAPNVEETEAPPALVEEKKIGEVAPDVEEVEAPPALVEEATPPKEEAAAAAVEPEASPAVVEKEVVVPLEEEKAAVIAPEVEPKAPAALVDETGPVNEDHEAPPAMAEDVTAVVEAPAPTLNGREFGASNVTDTVESTLEVEEEVPKAMDEGFAAPREEIPAEAEAVRAIEERDLPADVDEEVLTRRQDGRPEQVCTKLCLFIF